MSIILRIDSNLDPRSEREEKERLHKELSSALKEGSEAAILQGDEIVAVIIEIDYGFLHSLVSRGKIEYYDSSEDLLNENIDDNFHSFKIVPIRDFKLILEGSL